MGRNLAHDLATSPMPMWDKMHIHLNQNHFPPIHEVFIESAMRAIDLANTNNWDARLVLPNGLERSVADIIEGLHLEEFLEDNEY